MSVEWRLHFYSSLFLTSLALGMYSVFVPLFAQKLGASFLQLGFIGTAAAVTYVLTPILAGHSADRVSHVWIYEISLVLNIAATAALFFARTVTDIILLRAFGGVALAFLWPTSEVLVVDLHSEQGLVKEMGTFSVVWGSGYLIGPAIGGFVIPALGYPVLFELSSFLMLIGFVQALLGVVRRYNTEQAHPSLQLPSGFRDVRESISKLWPWYTMIVLYGVVSNVVLTIFPGYVSSVGVGVELVGILFATFGVARVVIFATIQYYARLGEAKVLTSVSVAIGCGVLMVALFPGFFVFLVALIIFGIGFAMIFPISITLISRGFPKGRPGVAVGSYESVFGLGSAIGPILAGTLASVLSVKDSFLSLAVVGFLMGAIAERNGSRTGELQLDAEQIPR